MEKAQIKIYAAFTPVGVEDYPALHAAIMQAGQGVVGLFDDEPWLFFEDTVLRIAFEGLYFPADDVLEALASALPATCEGKLDELRLDAWQLHRHTFKNGAFACAVRSLNHVLDYSGH